MFPFLENEMEMVGDSLRGCCYLFTAPPPEDSYSGEEQEHDSGAGDDGQ